MAEHTMAWGRGFTKGDRVMNRMAYATLVLGALALVAQVSRADIVTNSLAVYYRADNVDGRGNPGSGSTAIITNLVWRDV
jgi:hypothetical protein